MMAKEKEKESGMRRSVCSQAPPTHIGRVNQRDV